MRAAVPWPTRATASISSWAALKNVAANPSATPPPTTTRSRSIDVQIMPAARPTSRPVRRMMSYVGSVGERARDRLDRQPRRFRLETAAGAAAAPPTPRLDDDVADVTGVAGRPVEQLAVDHEAATDAGRHGHGAEARHVAGGAEPPLRQRQRLGIEISVHRKTGQVAKVLAQGKRPPRRDVDR